jgi:hypothetical protein
LRKLRDEHLDIPRKLTRAYRRPLFKLPIRFCADTLAREVAALPPGA